VFTQDGTYADPTAPAGPPRRPPGLAFEVGEPGTGADGLETPGFISRRGVKVGSSICTVTAWRSPDDVSAPRARTARAEMTRFSVTSGRCDCGAPSAIAPLLGAPHPSAS
jgi:hypothetical protein